MCAGELSRASINRGSHWLTDESKRAELRFVYGRARFPIVFFLSFQYSLNVYFKVMSNVSHFGLAYKFYNKTKYQNRLWILFL